MRQYIRVVRFNKNTNKRSPRRSSLAHMGARLELIDRLEMGIVGHDGAGRLGLIAKAQLDEVVGLALRLRQHHRANCGARARRREAAMAAAAHRRRRGGGGGLDGGAGVWMLLRSSSAISLLWVAIGAMLMESSVMEAIESSAKEEAARGTAVGSASAGSGSILLSPRVRLQVL